MGPRSIAGATDHTARAEHVCRPLMRAPGVGAIIAMTFRAGLDQPDRFRSSKQVAACFGLTTRKCQSGATDRSGSISRADGASVRLALFEAAYVIITRKLKARPLSSKLGSSFTGCEPMSRSAR